MATLALLLTLAGGCSTFTKKKQEPIPMSLTAEQRAWWEANRAQARYVPGKGYYVEGVTGYFDEQGRPVTSSLSTGGFADEEGEHDDFWSNFSAEKMKKRYKKAIGKGPNEKYARARFEEAEALYRQKEFAKAAAKYEEAYDRWPDSPLEEDCYFKAAEARFFADQYSKAEDNYELLTKKYAGTPMMDVVSKRRFAIAKYWEQNHNASPHWPTTPNVSDKTRPWFDTQGHALRVYEQIRLDDPTGPLADDAMMAIATNYFTRGRWEDADYYFGLLRSEYPKSDHQFNAHRLGLMAKLMKYQGPDYEGAPLQEADDLAKQLVTQFPTELGAERERIVQTRAEIRHQEALRDFQTAQYYDKGEYYGASRIYYDSVARAYPDTKLANESQSRLAQIKGLPAAPKPIWSWLQNLGTTPEADAIAGAGQSEIASSPAESETQQARRDADETVR